MASIACVIIGRLIHPASFWPLAATGALAGIVYAGLMLPLALEPPLGGYVRKAVAPFVSWLPGRRVGLPEIPR
jgi:hypothetical protein